MATTSVPVWNSNNMSTSGNFSEPPTSPVQVSILNSVIVCSVLSLLFFVFVALISVTVILMYRRKKKIKDKKVLPSPSDPIEINYQQGIAGENVASNHQCNHDVRSEADCPSGNILTPSKTALEKRIVKEMWPFLDDQPENILESPIQLHTYYNASTEIEGEQRQKRNYENVSLLSDTADDNSLTGTPDYVNADLTTLKIIMPDPLDYENVENVTSKVENVTSKVENVTSKNTIIESVEHVMSTSPPCSRDSDYIDMSKSSTHLPTHALSVSSPKVSDQQITNKAFPEYVNCCSSSDDLLMVKTKPVKTKPKMITSLTTYHI